MKSKGIIADLKKGRNIIKPLNRPVTLQDFAKLLSKIFKTT